MICHKKKNRLIAKRDGALLPMMAAVMVVLLVTVAIGVDIARMHLTRSELRTANDAAARAAVESLGRTQDPTLAEDAAIQIAARNKVAGIGLTLDRSQIKLGHAKTQPSGKLAFAEGGYLSSARVLGQRTDESPDGPVGLFFGPLFGVNEFSTDSVAAASQTQRDIGLVLDVSGSMAVEGRFQALADGVNSFLTVIEATPQVEYVSLTVYETTARQLMSLTDNTSILRLIFSIETPNGATAIGLGLQEGLDSVLNDFNARPYALKSIILMTDGNHNTEVDPEAIAMKCAAANVIVYTITFKDGADQARMRKLAESTGGTHLHANTNAELDDAFQTIAKQLAVTLIE